jgi:hypothetical protein
VTRAQLCTRIVIGYEDLINAMKSRLRILFLFGFMKTLLELEGFNARVFVFVK